MGVKDIISEINPEALTADGFDEAIIGMAERIGLGPIVAYDVDKIINILVERDGMSYYEYNIINSWMGEQTPIYVETSEFTDMTNS